MSDSFKTFMESKAGCALQHNVQRLADALEKLANPVQVLTVDNGNVTPIPVPQKDEIMAAFDDFVTRLKIEALLPNHSLPIAQARAKLHNLREETKDWNFTEVRPFYSRSYSFRQAENGFYRFVGTLMGHAPDQLFAVTIMGDCGCDTYKCSEGMSVRKFADWMANAYPDYLLSKGTHRPEFQAHKTREQMVVFFKEHADNFDDSERPGGPLTKPLWEQYGQNVDALLANACANTTDLYHLVQEAADDLDADTDICDRFKEFMTTDFFDHDWGMDYDAMDYARIEQLRWFGLWLLQQFPEVK